MGDTITCEIINSLFMIWFAEGAINGPLHLVIHTSLFHQNAISLASLPDFYLMKPLLLPVY